MTDRLICIKDTADYFAGRKDVSCHIEGTEEMILNDPFSCVVCMQSAGTITRGKDLKGPIRIF